MAETTGAGAASSAVFALADRYVDAYAALDPVAATAMGVAGHDDRMTDYSPAGIEARAVLARDTLAELDALEARDPAALAAPADRLAAAVMRERLGAQLDQHAAGERARDVRILGSPIQSIRQCFDLMPTDGADAAEHVAARLAAVPAATESLRTTLAEAAARGDVAARRQALACAEQCATWAGERGTEPYFAALVARVDAGADAARSRRLADGAAAASAAYAALGAFLRDEYAPRAAERDPVARERYALAARAFCGADLDLDDTYAWGWDELHRIEAAMAQVAERILPGEPIAAVVAHLEADPHRAIEGPEHLRAWLQDLIDRTIDELDGRHFRIAPPLRRCEAMLAPPGGAAAMYYTGPSEDFSRPGRTWYPTLGKTRFPLWGEVSICYHEAVPGHHLQIGQVRVLGDRLSRFSRLMGFVSGHGEGWALYAERLMGELGYLDDPAYELGMLRAQAMRAVRVVVDLGMHLELAIPEHERYHPGERWTPELALPFVIERSHFPADFMASEVDRYLGLPAQAISYKVGERVWLDGRAAAQARHGAAFDLTAFHEFALDLGPMGLDTLTAELARF